MVLLAAHLVHLLGPPPPNQVNFLIEKSCPSVFTEFRGRRLKLKPLRRPVPPSTLKSTRSLWLRRLRPWQTLFEWILHVKTTQSIFSSLLLFLVSTRSASDHRHFSSIIWIHFRNLDLDRDIGPICWPDMNRFLDGFSFVGGSLCSNYLNNPHSQGEIRVPKIIHVFFLFIFLGLHEGISFIFISLIGGVLFGACFLLPH